MLLLSAQPDFQVVGEACDGMSALQLVQQHKPRILLLDLMIPHVHGLEVTRQVSQDHPDTAVIILSMHKEESYVIEALRNGAAGYVVKDATGSDLIEAIRKVCGGRRYLSPALQEVAISLLEQRQSDPSLDIYASLTRRERLVLHLAAEGHNSADIAARLFISPRTAETHRSNLMRKLGLHSQTDLVRFAIRKGILEA